MTVERASLVEWWPLVDVGRLEVRPGDTVILRAPASLSAEARGRLRMAWEKAMPQVNAIVTDGTLDFIVKPHMREMRAEDLDQPVRKGTME